jgi:hypothetical protein
MIINPVSRKLSLFNFPAAIRPTIAARLYATQTGLGTTAAPTRRKTVTAFNDDGRVSWGDLSAREKVARTTQQSFNFSFIFLGAVLTVSSQSKSLWQLINIHREAWRILCIQKFSPSTAKPAISIERLIR